MNRDCLVASFYKFVPLPDFESLREPLLSVCRQNQLKGSILLAEEGVNGMIAGEPDSVNSVLDYLRSIQYLADLIHCRSLTDEMPFKRMKVRLKEEIVPFRVDKVNPHLKTGKFIEPEDWNAILRDPGIKVVDTRNDYEAGIGTFAGAENPHTGHFNQFPTYAAKNLDPAIHKKVAMFCTGGIRCEKASAYLLQNGFEEVLQLQGGILNYLQKIPSAKSLWRGQCFVFDGRVSVGQNLVAGSYQSCKSCGRPISTDERASSKYEEGVTCPHCHDNISDKKRAAARERQRQYELAHANSSKKH